MTSGSGQLVLPGAARRSGPAGRTAGWSVRRVLALRLAGAVAGGLLLYTSFPPVGDWWTGPLGVAVLTAALLGASLPAAALTGLLGGAALFLPLLSWVRVVGDDGWLLLAAAQAGWLAGLGAAVAAVGRSRWWPVWASCLWVTEEWVRGRFPFGGFTWGRLAFGQAGSPFAPLAAVGGAPLVTFAVALTGALLVLAGRRLLDRRPRPALAAGALIAAVGCAGLLVPTPVAGQASAAGPATATVAVVQGNVPRLGMAALEQTAAVLANHVAVTEQLAAAVHAGRLPTPALVVWPENSVGFDPLRYPQVAAALTDAARAVGRPLLVGAVLDGPGPQHVRNVGLVWDPRSGPGAMYVKQHLVPFGEYVPFRSLIGSWVGRFSLVPRDFFPGDRPGLLQIGPVRLADVICFEVSYDSLVRSAVDAGGRLLVVQTNDATFEQPGQPAGAGETAQQLAMARLRAVEHGRTVVVAATSGVSAVISPDGRVLASSRVFQPAVLDLTVPLRDSRTLADRLGELPDDVLAAAGLLAALAALAVRFGLVARSGSANRSRLTGRYRLAGPVGRRHRSARR